jgi:hypothetical protein
MAGIPHSSPAYLRRAPAGTLARALAEADINTPIGLDNRYLFSH